MLSPHRDKGQTDEGWEAAGGFSPQTHTDAGTYGCRCSPRPMPLRAMSHLYLTGNTRQKHLQKVSLTRSNAKSVCKLEQRQSRQGWAPVLLRFPRLYTHEHMEGTRTVKVHSSPSFSSLSAARSPTYHSSPLRKVQGNYTDPHAATALLYGPQMSPYPN